mmetsp:Transcript_7819/g.13442  ORF Transcript_7819/g.13442 Transcript_7819/m.13442 type:complete len:313 (-) Transcript_7819:625-1563(-)
MERRPALLVHGVQMDQLQPVVLDEDVDHLPLVAHRGAMQRRLTLLVSQEGDVVLQVGHEGSQRLVLSVLRSGVVGGLPRAIGHLHVTSGLEQELQHAHAAVAHRDLDCCLALFGAVQPHIGSLVEQHRNHIGVSVFGGEMQRGRRKGQPVAAVHVQHVDVQQVLALHGLPRLRRAMQRVLRDELETRDKAVHNAAVAHDHLVELLLGERRLPFAHDGLEDLPRRALGEARVLHGPAGGRALHAPHALETRERQPQNGVHIRKCEQVRGALDVVDAPRELEHLRHRAAQHGRVPFGKLGEVDVPVPVEIERAE